MLARDGDGHFLGVGHHGGTEAVPLHLVRCDVGSSARDRYLRLVSRTLPLGVASE